MAEERQGITDTDMKIAARIFNREGWALPQRYFHFHAASDLWEIHRIQPNGTNTTIAIRNDEGTWDDIGD